MAKYKEPPQHCWLIAYVDKDYIDRFYTDLKKLSHGRKEIEMYVPMVRILKKTFKGESHFESIPFLLNYGFFKVPRKYAMYKGFLDEMKTYIGCIYGWVNDTTKEITTKHDDMEDEDVEIFRDNQIPCATASDKEVAIVKESAYYSSIYSAEDIEELKASEGKLVTLMGYPFDNMQAEIVYVNIKKQKVKVKLELMDMFREVEVSFDNILFTIYHNKSYDDSITLADSLDMMAENSKLDKKLSKDAQLK